MKNEIGRKITSLTLMTIMVAGGLTFAIPGVMPTAYADVVQSNPHLYVSAEGQNSDNEVGPGNVIEVVIIDPLISDTDESKGEPDVQVNGNDLRMVQATDGAWYAYIADKDSALALDTYNAGVGTGLGMDFGNFCTAATAGIHIFESDDSGLTDTVGVAIPNEISGSNAALGTCGALPGTGDQNATIHVIREAEQPTPEGGGGTPALGQIGLSTTIDNSTAIWPFIQLYNFAEDGDIEIVYNRAGGSEEVTLLFDDPSEEFTTDRTSYTKNARVFLSVMDQALNVDPTDEDAWIVNTVSDSEALFYQILDENGGLDGYADAALTALDFYGVTVVDVDSEPFDEKIKINRGAQGTDVLDCTTTDDFPGSVVDVSADGECSLPLAGTAIAGDFPIAMVESGANTAEFVNWSEDNRANLVIKPDAKRGLTAEVEYADPGFKSILVSLAFGTITLDTASIAGEWNSGERLGLTVTDADANKNSLIDEDLDVNNARRDLIPSLRIGTPFTLGTAGTGSDSLLSGIWTNDTVDTVGLNPASGWVTPAFDANAGAYNSTIDATVQKFSDRGLLTSTDLNATGGLGGDHNYPSGSALLLDTHSTMGDLYAVINNMTDSDGFLGFNYLNWDLRSLEDVTTTAEVDAIMLINGTDVDDDGTFLSGAASGDVFDFFFLTQGEGNQNWDNVTASGEINGTTNSARNAALFSSNSDGIVGFAINFTGGPYNFDDSTGGFLGNNTMPIVIDFFSFGLDDRGEGSTRVNNAIYRIEAEETSDNSGIFEGTIEYTMTNQLNVLSIDTYDNLRFIDSDILFVVTEDLTDEDAPRVNYLDLGADGVSTQIGVQEDAPSHSGVVSFDSNTYKVADTVTITLEDADLNTDNDIIDIYTTVIDETLAALDPASDTIGALALGTFDDDTAFGRLLDITFDDEQWAQSAAGGCPAPATGVDDGLHATGITMVETARDSGVLKGDFQVPTTYCQKDTDLLKSVTGTDIEVNYLDFRDASGEIVEVGDSAGIRANTGSVSLDRTVYPVPFGTSTQSPDGSNFPLHASAGGDELPEGDLQVHIRINDPDFDISASGEDNLGELGTTNGPLNAGGPVKVTISRGANDVVLTTAGGPASNDGKITVGDTPTFETRAFGPINEIAPDAGIFELDLTILYTDGPASVTCPATAVYSVLDSTNASTSEFSRFDTALTGAQEYCILQGDIITVEYEDPTDASGDPNTVTDSATFDLRNGVLQSDKSVYIIGSDMILTLIEPDLDLDNDGAETWDLDLIEWDSDAATTTMGNSGTDVAAFDPEPSNFRETGDSTGIFQIVVEIPAELSGDRLERGEEIVLEYTDWGPSGADYVGDEDEDVNLTIFTSNFGATIELDQKVYTWTDKVYVTIVAPDHNFDSDLIDEIGDTDEDRIRIATRGNDLDNYKLVETGTDTGIFTGEVILTGFGHDADGDLTTGTPTSGFDTDPKTIPATGGGPTNGFLATSDDDGITVSFEFSEDETVVGSALVRWNIGETQWLEASYPAKGTGVVRIVDPDMNLNPESVDNFDVDVWSDSDSGGIDLTVTETNEATGIFEGTVFFTTTDESSGHRLRVSEGDTVTAEYEDNTLPDPYTTADELDITGTALIGTVVPPLERAPATNCRIVDAFGNSLTGVAADQQVQITCDLSNGQDRDQDFAYLVQLQDANGVTQALSWITGTLAPGQSFSPSQSWTPEMTGGFDVTVFVWESVDNPTALSPPVKIPANVN